MGSMLERPCPCCAAPLRLDAPLVTCAACDRDFSVETRRGGDDPYRDGALVDLRPGARPPPPAAGISDLGARWRIARGDGPVPGPVGRGVLYALGLGPLLLVRAERAPLVHLQIVAALLSVWALFCLGIWGVITLLGRARFEEVWVEDGVVGWRRGYLGVGLETLGFASDVVGAQLHEGHVRVRFGSGVTWHVGAGQHATEPGLAWLARRLRNATRAA
jgi:hypothetical protein